jgi:hypothetical protein
VVVSTTFLGVVPIREGGGSERLDDRAARRQDTADLAAYVVAQGVGEGTAC